MNTAVPSIDVTLIDDASPDKPTAVEMCAVPRTGEVLILPAGIRAKVTGVEHDYQKPEDPCIRVTFKRLAKAVAGTW